jgi:hypothetical protein
MSKVSKDQAAAKIRASDPLEVSLLTIARDLSDSQKRTLIEQAIKLIKEYVKEQRGVIICVIKEK